MKIVTTYVAYDDTVFDTMEECREYEQYAWDMFMEIIENTVIYDDNHNIIIPPYLYTIEEAVIWYANAYDSFTSILVKDEISSSAYAWQTNYFGYIFPTAPGFYEYDFFINEWIKKAE